MDTSTEETRRSDELFAMWIGLPDEADALALGRQLRLSNHADRLQDCPLSVALLECLEGIPAKGKAHDYDR